MVFLIISIFCSVAVSVLLKVARRHNVVIEEAIAVNYIVAAALCAYVLRPNIGQWQHYAQQWPLFLLLGVLLPSVFVIMARAVQSAGIVKADAAQRLSLFLPIVAAFVLFGEELSVNKIVGIVLAFLALLALLYKENGRSQSRHTAGAAWWLLGVWLGYGVIDILFKQLAKSGQALAPTLLVAFVLAAVLIWAYLLFKKTRFHAASVLAGLVLGGLNFANILYYIRAHQAFAHNPTLVFAGMNLGVISLATVVGAVLFKEKIHGINAAGIALALMAVLCLFYWTNLERLLSMAW